MNAVMQVAQALVTTGDNAVAITPCWPNVCRALQINSATVREVPWVTMKPAGIWIYSTCSMRATTARG